jgi:hypothetical protein
MLQPCHITQDFGFLRCVKFCSWLPTFQRAHCLSRPEVRSKPAAVSSSVMSVTMYQTTRRHIPEDCSLHRHKGLCSHITNLSFTSLHCSAGLGSWRICAQHCWNLPCSETRCHSSQSHLYMLKQNAFEISSDACNNTKISYWPPSLRV